MQGVLTDVLSYAIYALVVALIPVLIYGVKKITDSLIQYLGTKTDNEVVKAVLTEILQFTKDAVTYTAQTYVDSLKKNGEFTKDAQTEAFNRAKDAALLFITDESRDLFESVYGDLEEYLEMLIEAEVRKLKTTAVAEISDVIAIETQAEETTE